MSDAQTFDWSKTSFTRNDFISLFQRHCRLIGMIATRYTGRDDVDDSVSDFFLYMLDGEKSRWKNFDPSRGKFENWIGWEIRGFCSHRARSRIRYAKHMETLRRVTPRTTKQADCFSSIAFVEQFKFAKRRMSNHEIDAVDAIRRSQGNRVRAAAMLDITVPALNARLRKTHATLLKFGVEIS